MSDLQTILPPSSQPIELDLEQLSGRVGDLALPIGVLWDPEKCPLELLPWLAWSFSIEVWEQGWSEDTKRQAVKSAASVHRKKGTVASVKEAIAAAGFGDVEIIERFAWDFYDGKRLRNSSIQRQTADHWAEYRVKLSRPISIEQADQVRAILAKVAPARCRLKAFDFSEANHLFNAQIVRDGVNSRGIA